MEATVIVIILALFQYILFGVQVGGLRAKSGVKAPATTGDETFERMNRVHGNTMEQLIVLIPVMWMFGQMVNPNWGAAFGLVYIVGRFIYRAAYLKDPSSRSLGFMTSFLPSAVMAVWVLVVAVKSYL